jgi:4'-phosphopantetheinyl transferase
LNLKLIWEIPPTQLLFPEKELHFWRADLDQPGKRVQEFYDYLTADEKMRAERFHFERDRSRFITGRGILRQLLAGYLGVEPGAIRFCYGKDGKPELQGAFSTSGIQFNLSHSEGLALYAFTLDHEVGVDVEHIREISEMGYIAEQFFSVGERDLFGALPESEKQKTFFTWWTRKEACMKAIGVGLTDSPDRFDVAQVNKASVESSGIWGVSEQEPGWSMWDVNPADECAGAVAVKGSGWGIRCWQWPG